MKVAVSFLDHDNPRDTILKIDASPAEYIHVDLRDGIYVPKKNFDVSLPQLFKGITKPLDIHLMVENPLQYLDMFQGLNISAIAIHPKTVQDFPRTFTKIRSLNSKISIVLNPDETPNDYISILQEVDQVLLMAAPPGLGHQPFQKEVAQKIRKVKEINSKLIVGIDCGINNETIQEVKDADYVVSGSYIWQNADYISQIKTLQQVK